MLVDIGTEIGKGTLAKLVNYMDRHPICGECCGEITVVLPVVCLNFV